MTWSRFIEDIYAIASSVPMTSLLKRWKQSMETKLRWRMRHLLWITCNRSNLHFHRGLTFSRSWVPTWNTFWLMRKIILNIWQNGWTWTLKIIKESWSASQVSSRSHAWEKIIASLMSQIIEHRQFFYYHQSNYWSQLFVTLNFFFFIFKFE